MQVNVSQWQWMTEYKCWWKWMKVNENGIWIKVDGIGYNWMELDESGWKCLKMYSNLSKGVQVD